MLYSVYIATNKNHSVLYTGVTKDLARRMNEHKQKLAEGFSKRYNINELAYYEQFEDIKEAITREKQIKGGSRKKKIKLIEQLNLAWRDLSDEL